MADQQEKYTKMCQKLHKLGCWDPHMITHSVMCGHRDPRLPKSGKLECKNDEDLEGLYDAIDHFHQQRQPLTLCEMATPVFKYYQDVDVLLPHVNCLEEISEIEALWMECLIRCQAAVLGVIWRTQDALGCDKALDSTLVNVFASSGFAKRYNLFKISLHFIWEELHVSSHESKAIRNANLAFVASKQCGPLHRLLANAHKGEDPTLNGQKNPWEDILDKASSEGSSLRMPFTDKALKVDKKAAFRQVDTNDVMEGRPKLPVACYRVQLVPGDPGKCALKPVALVKNYSRKQWIERGSVRLPPDAKISAIWLPSTLMPEPAKAIVVQNVNRRNMTKDQGYGADQWQQQRGSGGKGRKGGGKTYKGSGGNKRTKPKPKPRDESTWIADNLRGYWMDDYDNVLNVWVEQSTGQIKVYRGDSNMQIGTISVVDPNEFPIKLYFSEERSRSLWVLDYKGDNDLQGTWKSNDGNPKSDWNWRRPAVYKKTEWPRWGARVLLNISGSVDGPNRTVALGVVINAVGVQAEAPNVKQMWHGSLRLDAQDLPESGEITVPMACLAAATLGLRVCIDLGLDKKEIMVGTDHSIVEAQFNNMSRKIAADLKPIVEVLDDYRARLQYPVRVTQTTAHENQATEVARACRQNGYSTVGDRRLYEACQQAVEARGNPGGLNALKQITSINQQYGQYYAGGQNPAIQDAYPGNPGMQQPGGQQQYPALTYQPNSGMSGGPPSGQPQQLGQPGGKPDQNMMKGGNPQMGGGPPGGKGPQMGGPPQMGPGGMQGPPGGMQGPPMQGGPPMGMQGGPMGGPPNMGPPGGNMGQQFGKGGPPAGPPQFGGKMGQGPPGGAPQQFQQPPQAYYNQQYGGGQQYR
ncbi:unnamed protein product [Amoebophrya sp. A120]|nr:unnamed protein product [Amoebophrya sp. A120]|eukprot:GSA120T00008924001.1